jgi:DNA polymerase-3 subunit alpha
MNFTHLHVHSNYSTFDGLAKVVDIVDKCIATGMNAVAITDHGNMRGAKKLLDYCKLINKERSLSGTKPFVPIVGVEAYCARRGRHSMSDTIDRGGWHVILLAKNKIGYQNLCRLVSESNQEDAFFVVPRIDHELLEQYHEGIICCSACIGGELPQKVLAGLQSGDMSKARKTLKWYKNLFGDDYYIEIQRHETRRKGANRQTFKLQSAINPVLIDLAHEYGVKIICSNDCHFINKDDADAQDLLMCRQSNKKVGDKDRIRYSKQEWIKSPQEMEAIFSDLPEALTNTQEIVEKVELYDIDHAPILPKQDLPVSPSEYLHQQVLQGGIERYGATFVQSPEFTQRVETELEALCSKEETVSYLLVLADLVNAAHKLDIMVGPGRSSAAGSLVLYCLGITDIDPLKYGLLFERFYDCNKILPNIDIDFEDCERGRLLEYLIQKYGEKHISRIFMYNIHDSIREPSLHSFSIALCGEELRNVLPLSSVVDKRTNKRVFITDYYHYDLESVGVVKLDILGLTVLTMIKRCLNNIKQAHGIDLDINTIPLNDERTFRLFQEGRTIGVFQFEAEDMRKHLQNHAPQSFDELMALNALFRPLTMENIQHYIARKKGIEPTTFVHPVVEDILKETRGIIVYQEQIMLLFQRLANFTPEESDKLRRTFGKISPVVEELKRKFIRQGLQNGYDELVLSLVWDDIKKSALFAFVKAHAACYTWLAYQVAYLKAHYPLEFLDAYATIWERDVDCIKLLEEELSSITR